MSTNHPRAMVVLEPPLYRWLKNLAKREGLSLSMKLRDFVRDAYEQYEDRYWAKAGEQRLRSLRKTPPLSHDALWKKLDK